MGLELFACGWGFGFGGQGTKQGSSNSTLYIGIMENKKETTIVYRGYIGTMENGMETTLKKTLRLWQEHHGRIPPSDGENIERLGIPKDCLGLRVQGLGFRV